MIAGCRDYNNYNEAKEFIDSCLSDIRKEYSIVIISGGAKGADAIGERYATENGFAIERYPANWEKYGRSAGPRRNMQMTIACDLVICFWDGKSRGSRSMIDCAARFEKPLNFKTIR